MLRTGSGERRAERPIDDQMAIANLIALLLLSPIVFQLTRVYFRDQRAEQVSSAE